MRNTVRSMKVPFLIMQMFLYFAVGSTLAKEKEPHNASSKHTQPAQKHGRMDELLSGNPVYGCNINQYSGVSLDSYPKSLVGTSLSNG